jgi:hypothetical protein
VSGGLVRVFYPARNFPMFAAQVRAASSGGLQPDLSKTKIETVEGFPGFCFYFRFLTRYGENDTRSVAG